MRVFRSSPRVGGAPHLPRPTRVPEGVMRRALRAAAPPALAPLLAPAAAGAERPRITGLRVVANSPTDPVVRAIVNPGGLTTTWHVEYGPTEALCASTPAAELPAGTDDVVVTAVLAG